VEEGGKVPRRDTAGSLMSGGRFLVKDVNVSILGYRGEIRCGCAEGKGKQ